MSSRVFLIGGFNKAKYLAKSLIKRGYIVTAINKDGENCRLLAETEKLTVYNGDGSIPSVLDEANAYNADIAIALTDRDDDNLVICVLCKKRFRVKKTVALITDPGKIDFFYRIGIDSVVCDISVISSVIEQHAFLNDLIALIPIGEGRIKISQVYISAAAPSAEKTIKELNLPQQVIIGCIQRGDQSMIPHGDTRIHAGDVLALISLDERESVAVRILTGRWNG
jgi:trk system potassium uptake protein TrkA